MRKWRPAIAQLEFTQMAQYAADCAPARTILVEHDITFDLYQQLLGIQESAALRREVALWRSFETAAWSQVDRVVTMSEKDRRTVAGAPAVALPNGVDLERFRPAEARPSPASAIHRQLRAPSQRDGGGVLREPGLAAAAAASHFTSSPARGTSSLRCTPT